MKKLTVFLAVMTIAASTFGFATFDSNNELWSKANVTVAPSAYETVTIYPISANWATETGGNGYVDISSTGSQQPRAYNLGIYREDATGSLLGDLTGKTVKADFKRLGDTFKTVAGTAPTVRLVISDATSTTSGYQQATWYYSKYTVDITSFLLNGLTSNWQGKEFAMTADNFFVWPNGKIAGMTGFKSFTDLISDQYNFIGFTILSTANSGFGFSGKNLPDYGAYSTGSSSTLAVDNLRAIPEPATLAILALGGLLIRRKKA